MNYQEIKQKEQKRAEDFVAEINASKDPAIMYKDSYPIADLQGYDV